MQDSMDFGLQLLRVAASLAVVIATMLAALYGLKRWGHWVKRTHTASLIEVLGQHSFSPKHHLMVVKVKRETFLLGISPEGMHLLAPLHGTPEEPSADGGEEKA